jgi:hypothetical protein
MEYFRSKEYSPEMLCGLLFGNFRRYSGTVQDFHLLTDSVRKSGIPITTVPRFCISDIWQSAVT